MTLIKKILVVATGTTLASSTSAFIAFSTRMEEPKKEEISVEHRHPAHLVWGKDIGTYEVTYGGKEQPRGLFEDWF